MQQKGAGLSRKQRSTTSAPARQLGALAVAGLILTFKLMLGAGAQAQGILTVTPGRTAATAAGAGTLGYSGDGSTATAATLAAPSAVAYDASGNLFLADANNHVIREVVKSSGNIVTVAGMGVAGFGGDGGAATSAYLDTPTGIAVDASGNLYIADSHNQRIRKVTGTTISTIAGTGTAGFSGDGGGALSAALNLPSAVAVDGSGTVYIADTNNHRIRGITGTTISTIAGIGEQNFSGDGGAATSAALDSPTGVAVDASGNIYIADRHNHRIREVSAGIISTVAGSGTPTFAGGFSGDGSSATAAMLAKPSGVAVDGAGNVYIADTNNQRVRELAGGTVTSVAGIGDQGFAGDGGTASSAVLNAPRSVASDSSGNLALAEPSNQRVRSALLSVLAFGNQFVGQPGTAQSVTLSNTGTASFSLSSITFTGSFLRSSGGTCSSGSITLAAGASCSLNINFLPVSAGAASGSVVFSGMGVVAQSILLTGTGVQVTPTKLVYTSAPPTPLTAGGNAGTVSVALEDNAGNVATSNSGVTVTMTVSGPSGSAQTYAGSTTNGIATFDLSSTPLRIAGTYTYTASATGLTSAEAIESINPGAAVSLSFTGLSIFTAPQQSGTATVRAMDSYGNTAIGFAGTVTLTSTDITATFSPMTYTYAAADAGTHSFTVTFNTAGTQGVTATSGSLAGSETGILVEDSILILNGNGTLVRTTDAGVQTTAFGSANSTAATSGAVAFDNTGNIWAVTNGSSTVQEFTPAGTVTPVSGSSAAGVTAPVSLFLDGDGQVWVANGNNSVSVLTNTGAAVSPSGGYRGGAMNTPSGILVDSAGAVWVSNRTGNSVTKIFGAAAPVVAPTVTGTTNNTLGTRP